MWAYGGDFGELEHDGNFCLNGLNWPDRGIHSARSTLNSDNKWGTILNQRNRHIYGSSGLNYGPALTSIDSNTWANVTVAQSKPCLIEAKQCMKCFEISVIGIKTPGNIVPVIRDGYLQFETFVRFSVVNHMDHIDDIQTEINFRGNKIFYY